MIIIKTMPRKRLPEKKQDILTDALLEESLEKTLDKADRLPWATIGYDYVDNALEVTIASDKFTEPNITKYLKKIRTIVGDEVDITLSPADVSVPDCAPGRCSTTNPIKGGVEFDTTTSGPCTVGFKATYDGDTGFVSAGHCGDNTPSTVNQPWGGTDVGEVTKETMVFRYPL